MRFCFMIFLVALMGLPAVAGPLDDMSSSIMKRLEAAELVAAAKYASDRPVEDKRREAAVIENAVNFAASYTVDMDFARVFFQAQMDANKSVQADLITTWKTEGLAPLDNPPSLTEEVRPFYDALTPKLLVQFLFSQPVLEAEGGCEALTEVVKKQHNHKYYAAYKTAIAPLGGVVPGDCVVEG